MLSLLPLFHAYSQVVNLWVSTIIGARVVYITELSSVEIERGLKEGGATALVGVPRLWYLFHKKIFDAVGGQPLLVRRLFRIVGRKKDVIKLPTGKQIFPDDVEAHYGRSPLVSEICVLGVRDPSSMFERAEKLCAVVVPDFDYLKAHHIANAREAIRFELDNLGRELPEYQRVRDYIIRAEPLPRTTTRKVKRFELKNQVEASGEIAGAARQADRFVFSSADHALMNSPAGRAVAASIKQQSPEAAIIHPQMNLELDLGLDSLARAEWIVSVERALDARLAPEAEAEALTVGEVVALVQSISPKGRLDEQTTSQLDWREILASVPSDDPDLQPIFKHKPLAVVVGYALLRLIFFAARILLRLEVEGRDVLVCLRRPFLICPNHQSYLDAIVLCSTYPRGALPHIFHVGASEYFANPFMKWLARTLNIVPVDPDTHLLRAMRASAGGLRAGKILNLYPEGQRSFDGRLQAFKHGAAILTTELDLPVVPVAIDGMYRVWPRNSWRIRPAKVRISFGEPFTPRSVIPDRMSGEAAYVMVTDELKKRIQRMLDENEYGRR